MFSISDLKSKSDMFRLLDYFVRVCVCVCVKNKQTWVRSKENTFTLHNLDYGIMCLRNININLRNIWSILFKILLQGHQLHKIQ